MELTYTNFNYVQGILEKNMIDNREICKRLSISRQSWNGYKTSGKFPEKIAGAIANILIELKVMKIEPTLVTIGIPEKKENTVLREKYIIFMEQ